MVSPRRTRPRTRGGQFGGWLSAAAQPGSPPFFVLTRRTDPKTGGSELGAWLAAAAGLAAIVVVLAAVRLPGAKFGQLLILGAVALVLGVMVLRSAPFATIILIIAIGLRQATPHVLPIDTFWIAFAGVVGAFVLWMDRNPDRPRGMDAIEWAMALYIAWNVYSMISPHEYNATDEGVAASMASGPLQLTTPVVVWRVIIGDMLLPLVMYRVGRYAFDRAAAVRALLWSILILAAYSAAMSIMQFTGPTELVWPRYIVDRDRTGPAGPRASSSNRSSMDGYSPSAWRSRCCSSPGAASQPGEGGSHSWSPSPAATASILTHTRALGSAAWSCSSSVHSWRGDTARGSS